MALYYCAGRVMTCMYALRYRLNIDIVAKNLEDTVKILISKNRTARPLSILTVSISERKLLVLSTVNVANFSFSAFVFVHNIDVSRL